MPRLRSNSSASVSATCAKGSRLCAASARRTSRDRRVERIVDMVASMKTLTRASPMPVDWRQALDHALLSRALDDLEETVLTPARKVLYQFSARGHEVTQALLAQQLC